MIFTKYLFGAIAALTGGVNALVFSSSGGALTSKELEELNSELGTAETNHNGLINSENSRIKTEESKSAENFKKLENENKNTKSSSRSRREAGNNLTRANDNLVWQNLTQNAALGREKTKLQSELNSKTESFKTELKTKVQASFNALQTVVKQETDKLESALTTLKESNRKLIDNLKKCLIKMPEAIFTPDQDWCPETQQFRANSAA
ncbi:hypothetical protein [Candidatus Mycoplasma haematominutum]|uniref:hypothetical protein n=1 Tax=Candidatus Mycoplasma haematominutum TaxID=209446 RepID=UPI0002E6490E|nr:hypothetical protein [Candidatus Mycoplasma haematominutum]